MAKSLVIVESPAKAKTINKILGGDFMVKSSMGHVRDLPVKTLGVDVEDGFKPKYVVVQGRKKIIEELRKAAEECETVYLAPDPDREGEAIAWHLQEVLQRSKDPRRFCRVQYNEITPGAVRKAIANPGEIDMRRVDAQQARRVLDRLVGYKVSPMLWRRLRRGLSAGRVQSVALRLVCEREDEIRRFVTEKFWLFGARVRKLVAPLDPFRIKLIRMDGQKADLRSEQAVVDIRAELQDRPLKVTEVNTREVRKTAPPPYITSTLQQAGSTYCGFSPRRTMTIAQKLYEGVDLGEGAVGLITYMRTDSFSIAREALDSCRDYIRRELGENYLPEKPNAFRSRAGAQEAHEAIRPTDVNRLPDTLAHVLNPSELKIYRLIWRRFVASQMVAAQIEQRTVKISAEPAGERTREFLFQATASEVKFPGYMRVSHGESEAPAEEESTEESERLPVLVEGERVECLEWLSEEKETQPPQRFSEATLVRALESNGVGRPSTYAQILSTLEARRYVLRRKRMLEPTDLGMRVNALLVSTLDKLFDVNFTAGMEASLDKVESGEVQWTQMLQDFNGEFSKWMDATREPAADRGFVDKLLKALETVQQWAPEVTQGKRKFSDQKFVASIRTQLDAAEKEISQKQMKTLGTMVLRYKDQLSGVEALLNECGLADLFARNAAEPPPEVQLRKLEILGKVQLSESAERFVKSLSERVQSGRSLTESQSAALDRVILSHARLIENFEAVRTELDLQAPENPEDDQESGPLIQALSPVQTWKEPVMRGKKSFDDKAFYESLSSQFARKGFLSVRQRAALKRLVRRYREQVPNYEAISETLGLEKRS
jgi:DNA topoisomerase-1